MVRGKRAKVRRIHRVRNRGFDKIARSFSKDIKRATFNLKDTKATSKALYASMIAGSVPNKPKDLFTFFKGLDQRINKMIIALAAKYRKAFNLGANKIMDSEGKILTITKPSFQKPIEKLLKGNLKYVKNITDTQRKKMIGAIKQGIEDGKGFKKIAVEINKAVKNVSETRAELIASTEVNRAIAESQQETMIANGFDRYMWITANDNRVAPLDEALHKRIFKFGQTGFMNVKGTDNKTYTIHKSPLPIRDSHVRCRCIIVAPTKR